MPRRNPDTAPVAPVPESPAKTERFRTSMRTPFTASKKDEMAYNAEFVSEPGRDPKKGYRNNVVPDPFGYMPKFKKGK